MQRRLLLLFLLFSFLPSAALLGLNWRMGQEMLGYLDSPGLHAAMESSLELAREMLEREKADTAGRATALAATLAAGMNPPPTADEAWSHVDGRGAGTDSLRALLAEFPRPAPGRVERVQREGRDYLLAAAASAGDDVILLRALDAELVARLEAVARGGGRHRQLRGVYRDLLRGHILFTLLALGLLLLLLSLWLSRRFARQLAAPLGDLVAGTERIAAGELDHRVETRARHEVAELVAAFNRMGEQLETGRADLLKAERIAAWQGIARRLAHEIKNPLTPINLAMHRIAGHSDEPAVSESIQAVLEETANLKRLADEFSLFAKLPEPEPQAVDLRPLLAGVVELYAPVERYATAWAGWPEVVPLRADPGQLRQLLANLIKNAAEAMGAGGRLTLLLAREPKHWRLSVVDSGQGFAGEPETLFEPYVTSKAAGTGLGLAIARKIAEDHGGGLTAAHADAGGARFDLRLPALEEEKQ